MSETPTIQQERGIKRISSLMDAWWKVALILVSLVAFVVSSVKSWMEVQAAIQQGKANKDRIDFIMENMARKDDIESMDDKVTRQWGIQSGINDRQDTDIREIREKQVFEDGRRSGQIKER